MKNIEAKINIDSSQLKSAFAGINDFSKTIKDKLGNFKIGFDTSGVKSETKKVTDDVEAKFGEAGKKAGDSFSTKFKSGITDVFKVAGGQLLANGIQSLATGLKNAAEAGINFEKSLADFSALTGVGGEALKGFGDSARNLSKEFGTDAISQIETFKGILSRLGPDIAKSPEALNEMAIAVNTLAIASGMDATTSMEALTTILLQFGVNLDDPIFAAQEMTRAMNIMAAGANYGSAEIPQVSEAIKVAGVAAKQANISMEETNAAIQALGDGGKYGAEAGTALRNVLSKIAGEDIIPKEAADKLKALGVNMNVLSDTSLPLSARLKELGKAQKDATAYAQTFGVDNAAAAAILVNSADSIQELTKQITGTSIGFDQAATNMDTIAFKLEKFKAQLGDMGLELFGALQKPLTDIIDLISTNIFPTLLPIINSLTTIIQNAGKMIANILKDLAPVINTLLASITPAIGAIIEVITNLAPVLAGIYTSLQPIITAVMGIITTLLPKLIPLLNPIMQIVTKLIVMLSDEILIVIESFLPTISTLIETLVPIIGIVADIINIIMPLIKLALIPLTIQIKVVSFLTNMFAISLKFVANIAKEVSGFLSGIVDKIKEIINGIGEFLGIVEKKKVKLPKIDSTYDKDVKTVKTKLNTLSEPIKSPDFNIKDINSDVKQFADTGKKAVATYSDLIAKLVDLEVAGKKGSLDYTKNYASAIKLKDSENERSKIQDTLNKQVETEILLRDKNFKSQQQIVDLLLEQNNISFSTDEIENLRTLAAEMNIEQKQTNLLKEAELTLIKEKEKLLEKEARTMGEIFKELKDNNNRDLIPPKALEQPEGYISLLDEINEKEKRNEEKKNAKQDLIDYFAVATDLSKTTSEAILDSSMAFGEGMTNMLMSGTYFFKSLGKAALATIVDYVQKQVLIEGVAILSKYSSTLGPPGFIAGLAVIGIINGLLSAAMTKIQGAETGYMEGIKQVGKKGRSDTQMIWFNPKEVIIPEPMVNQNRDMLAAMFNGTNPEIYYKQKYEKENINTNIVPIKTSNSINANFTHSFKDVKVKGSDLYLSIDKIKRKEMIRG